MKKISKMAEFAWVIGTILCAFGIAVCTKANLGLSMFAAPAYSLHIRFHEMLPWLTQGTAQYLFDGGMMAVMCLIIRRFRFKYLLSFAYGVLFGITIDLWLMILGGGTQFSNMAARILGYVVGNCAVTLAIDFMFRTYLPPQVPELVVLEVTKRFRIPQPKIKQIVDFSCLAISVAMALLLTGAWTGVGIGTVVTALINAPLIRFWSNLLGRVMTFDPLFPKVECLLK